MDVQETLALFTLKHHDGVFVDQNSYLLPNDTFVFCSETYSDRSDHDELDCRFFLVMIKPEVAARIEALSVEAAKLNASSISISDPFYYPELHNHRNPGGLELRNAEIRIEGNRFSITGCLTREDYLNISSDLINIDLLQKDKQAIRGENITVLDIERVYQGPYDDDRESENWENCAEELNALRTKKSIKDELDISCVDEFSPRPGL